MPDPDHVEEHELDEQGPPVGFQFIEGHPACGKSRIVRQDLYSSLKDWSPRTVNSPCPDTSFPFALEGQPHKSATELVQDDVEHFGRLSRALDSLRTSAAQRLDELRHRPRGNGQDAVQRDVEIHRLTSRVNLLQRYGIEMCLGRITGPSGSVYIGRTGISDTDGNRLLVDWRAPAAAAFFAATRAEPQGYSSRRRYRWESGRIVDYWDEALDDAAGNGLALDDQSAFIAELGASRSSKMRDVVGTIQADQDEIIRASSEGTLVVDGGPGTGKTVVALHRAAYLMYSDPALASGHGKVLFIGPSRAYSSFVANILPGLGEEGVIQATLADLVPGVGAVADEPDPAAARLKSDQRMLDAVQAALRSAQRGPDPGTIVESPWGELRITARRWQQALSGVEAGTSHNEARAVLFEELVESLSQQIEERDQSWGADIGYAEDAWAKDPFNSDDPLGFEDQDETDEGWRGYDDQDDFDAYGMGRPQDDGEALRSNLRALPELAAVMDRAWPLVDPYRLVRGLWSEPALLRSVAPWLGDADIAVLSRPRDADWTVQDLPLLDAALSLAGDPQVALDRRDAARAEEEAERERANVDQLVGDLVAADDSDLQTMSMLRGQDLRAALEVDLPSSTEVGERSGLEGPFAHIIVDEAQELTDTQWRMLVSRNPSGSFTVVGDRAQARAGFRETWEHRLVRAGLGRVRHMRLNVNYRTPREIMERAAPVILEAMPDANVPTSVRSSGIPVRTMQRTAAESYVYAWLRDRTEGTAAVIGVHEFATPPRARSLEAREAKGLEFDLVVVPDPGGAVSFTGHVDLYVAMTRATRELIVLA